MTACRALGDPTGRAEGGDASFTTRSALEPAPTAAPGAPETPSSGQAAVLAAPVTIVPDELTNSLLVRATPADLAVIQSAVEQLDLRPLQVLIEVLTPRVLRDDAAIDASAADALEAAKRTGAKLEPPEEREL